MNLRNAGKHLSQWAADYLTYNRAEQRGIFVLSLVLLCVIITQALIPSETFQKAPDFRAFSQEIAAFEAAWKRAADSDSIVRSGLHMNYRNRNKPYLSDSGHTMVKFQKPVLVVDLNRADTFDLQQLRGIGPAFARRIVNYRERLGGYSEAKQVMEVFGMDSARFASIASNLTVTRDSIHPLDLNTVTFKEMLHHPYFPFAVTKNIMIYRQKNKTFKKLDELRNIQGISDSLFRRMIIYLRLGP